MLMVNPGNLDGLRDIAIVDQIIHDSPTSIDLRHHVLLAEPSREQTAKRHLVRHGFEPYVPVETKTEVFTVRTMFGTQRRERKVARPIFPGYVFVPLNVAWSFGPIYEMPGLRRGNEFLRINGEHVILRADDVRTIQALEYGLVNPVLPGLPFKVGDTVRIVDGPFLDCIAEIARIDSAERIELLMDLFGGRNRSLATSRQIALD